MNFYDDYMDDDFFDYEMKLTKIKGFDFTFHLKLNDRIEYGTSDKVVKFLINECLFYLRNKYPCFKGHYILIHINRLYNGKYHNFVNHATFL